MFGLTKIQQIIGSVAVLVTAVTAFATYHTTLVNKVKEDTAETVRVDIQRDYNKLISEQNDKHKAELQIKLDEWERKQAEAVQAKADYLDSYYAKREADLKDYYESLRTVEEIQDEADTIDDTLNTDTVRLFNQAIAIISPPTDYPRSQPAASGLVTTDTERLPSTLLSRSYVEPIGNNK